MNEKKVFTKSKKARWFVWVFPLIAVGVSGALLYNYYQERGPVIKIKFNDAAGIQSEKTRVRYRGVAIGTVRDVYISDDMDDVIAEVTLRKDAAHFAVEGSKFSLVVPKVSFQGISGLETVFEGSYITVLPGKTGGSEQLEFKAQSGNVTDPLDDTVAYTIETPNVESINPGDSVTFRGMKVGSVTKLTLAKESQTVHVQINLESRYARLVRTNTVFWKKVGVQAKLGLFKSEIKVNSMDAIVNGGIEFATPDGAGAMVKSGAKFVLSAPPKDWEKWSPKLTFSK